jgi:hypothetical protein
VGGQHPRHGVFDDGPIVGMDSAKRAPIARFEHLRLQTEYPVQLFRPAHPILGDIAFPAAYSSQRLRLGELVLAFLHRLDQAVVHRHKPVVTPAGGAPFMATGRRR